MKNLIMGMQNEKKPQLAIKPRAYLLLEEDGEKETGLKLNRGKEIILVNSNWSKVSKAGEKL